MSEVIQYQTTGVCCGIMQVKVRDEIVEDAEFHGGCSGNLNAIKSLIKGMKVDDVVEKLKGIKCGDKATSCPDQLAKCLLAYKNKKIKAV